MHPVIPYLESALVGALAVAVYVRQDGALECNDGRRYTSGKPQPEPFHRRFCSWPRRLLVACSWLSIVAVAASLGDPLKAALFATLPGAWFCATRPTTVDAPSMALAWASGALWARHPAISLALATLSGFLHERGAVFASLYAWSPWPGGVALAILVPLWRKPGRWDGDPCVGFPSTWVAMREHKKYQEWLSWRQLLLPARAVVPLAAWLGAPPSAWAAFAVAQATRLVGTENGRFAMWGALPLVASLGDVPAWAVALHVLTFERLP